MSAIQYDFSHFLSCGCNAGRSCVSASCSQYFTMSVYWIHVSRCPLQKYTSRVKWISCGRISLFHSSKFFSLPCGSFFEVDFGPLSLVLWLYGYEFSLNPLERFTVYSQNGVVPRMGNVTVGKMMPDLSTSSTVRGHARLQRFGTYLFLLESEDTYFCENLCFVPL